MSRFTDLVSKYIIQPAISTSDAKALIAKQVEDEATKHLADATALAKLSGNPLGWAYPATQLRGVKVGQTNAKPSTGISFAVLRDLSTFYWCARACINKRQEQIHNLEWEIVSTNPENDEKLPEDAVRTIKDFFRQIAGPSKNFRQFLDMVIDDLLTLDGAAIERVRDGNQLALLWPVDAATIRLRVSDSGMVPLPPEVAYEQWVRGKLVAEFTTDDMSYLMMNARTNSPYGLSPLESLILIVNAALKSEGSNLAMLTQGNIPEGLISLPTEWTADQIKDFQLQWDAMTAGDIAQQRQVKFIPGGQGTQYIPTKKPSDMEFSEMEKWLAVKTCAMFGVSPQSIGMTFDINKATASEQATLTKNESIRPLVNLLEEFFDFIIQNDLGFTDLRFHFKESDIRDEKSDAEVGTKYISMGVRTINEVRADLGLDAIDGGDEPFVMTGTGPVLLKDVINPPEPVAPPAPQEDQPAPSKPQEPPEPPDEIDAVADLKRWRKVALRDLEEGRPFRKFQSIAIAPVTLSAIDLELQGCSTSQAVRETFRKHIALEHDRVLDAAGTLLRELDSLLKSDAPKAQPTHQ